MYNHKIKLDVKDLYPQDDFKTSWLVDVRKLFKDVYERQRIIADDFYMLRNSRIITHMFIHAFEETGWYNMQEIMSYDEGKVFVTDLDCKVLETFEMDLKINFEQETILLLLELRKIANEYEKCLRSI